VAKGGSVAVYFLDTSALVKRYVAEAGSDRVMSVVGEPGATIVIADLARVEFASALRRRVREGDVTEDQQRVLRIAFASHLVRDYPTASIRGCDRGCDRADGPTSGVENAPGHCLGAD